MGDPDKGVRISCYVTGAIAALGTWLQYMGFSPGRVSGREPGVDLIINHLVIFGPFVLLCWVLCAMSRERKELFLRPLLATIVFALGLLH